MPPKASGRIHSNVDTASQHPDRSTVTTSVAKPTSPKPTDTTATTAGDEADKVEVLSSSDSAQLSDKTKSSQSASQQQQQVVSEQFKKFLVTCLVVAGIGWLLAVVGICTDHWISYSLMDVGQSVTEDVDRGKPVTEGVNTVTDSVTDGGVVTEAVHTVADVIATDTETTVDDTVNESEAMDTAEQVTSTVTVTKQVDTEPPVTSTVTETKVADTEQPVTDVVTQPPIVTTSREVMQSQNVITEVKTTTDKTVGEWLEDMAKKTADAAKKKAEEAACEARKFFSGNSNICRSLGTDRVGVGLFDSGMDFDSWMVIVQGLILTGLIYATAGMVLMVLHLVLKGRKPWMPTVGGVSCVVGGIFIITGIMVNFIKTPYHHEPDWSFFLTFNGGLLFMVAGVLILFLERYDRVQALRENNKCSILS